MATVTPWTTETKNGSFEYDKLVTQFGVQKITPELLARFEKVTGHKLHPWLRRGLFFAHRDLDKILDDYEQKKPIYIYTGRGPSPAKAKSSMHLGHLIPFKFTKWLQDVFNAFVVIQIADDEKFYFKDTDFKTVYELGFENAKDIIACGFDVNRTFIFSNRDYSANHNMHTTVHEFLKHINIKTVQAIFGIEPTACLGQLMWPVYQSCPAYSRCFGMGNIRCLVTYAIDQDPFFRLCRDVADKLQSHKPCSLVGQFLPALTGKNKMSTTETGVVTTIFLTDSKEEVQTKITKYAFSGGRDTKKLHMELGADLSVDIPYQWLVFLEDDDHKLQSIAEEYGSGRMFTKEVKLILIDKVTTILDAHQRIRESVTDDIVKKFYEPKKLN
jgi:tryptophanyl-tRNA synthetase